MTSKLSFVSLSVISALLILSFVAITTTSAYAQPQGRWNSQACPEGFELNRGVCQAEPELTCEPYGEGYELTDIENIGLVCYKVETAEPECIPPFPSSAINYWDGLIDFRCESGQYPNGVASNIQPTCNHLEGQGWRFGFIEGTDIGTCLRELREQPVQECSIGVLNEESGLCEVRPGRGIDRA